MNTPPPQPRSPWITVAVVLSGTYAFTLNGHVTGIALPSIAADLGESGLVSVDWVVTAFIVGVVLVLPATGWLADQWGRRNVIASALALFTIGCVICLVAPNMEVLLVGRFLQGFGGGVLLPLGMATVYDLFPPERRGKALGVWGIAMTLAPAAGPPLGGWLIGFASWRWMFAGFAVVAAPAGILSYRLIADAGVRAPRRLDALGWALAAIGVTAVVVGARESPTWGITSPATITVVGVGIFALVAFGRRCQRSTSPMVEFAMYRVPTFAIAMAVLGTVAVAQFARINLVPVQLQVVRGLEPPEVGVLLAPAALGIAVTMPIGGWLVDRFGARLPVTIGAGFAALGTWLIAHLEANGPTLDLVVAVTAQGIGNGLVIVPTTIAALNSLPRRFVSQASGLNELTRQVSAALGMAVLSAVLVANLGSIAPPDTAPGDAQDAYNQVFMIAFWIVASSVVLAIFLPGPRRSREHQAMRRTELEVMSRAGASDPASGG